MNWIIKMLKFGTSRAKSCKHTFGPTEKIESFRETGQYVGEIQIMEKVYLFRKECKECGHLSISDDFPFNF